jgi:hypothetical protein
MELENKALGNISLIETSFANFQCKVVEFGISIARKNQTCL